MFTPYVPTVSCPFIAGVLLLNMVLCNVLLAGYSSTLKRPEVELIIVDM